MTAYFLNDLNFRTRDAGFKARKDAADIARKKENVKVVDIPLWGDLKTRAISVFRLTRFLLTLRKSDTLVFNFPVAKPFWFFFVTTRIVCNFKMVALIHDIDSLRGVIGLDLERLVKCDMVISHNSQMTNYLCKYISREKIKEIKIFDYLSINKLIDRNISDNTRGVIYAGNLSREKCAFIYEPECELNLYGVNYENNDNPRYYGSFDAQSPDKIRMDGMQFGLVWDGDSTGTCSGMFGEYLKYNNPHKTSLYLSMELPIFIWKDAALAEFVIRNDVGYAIESIKEMNEIISLLTKDEYMKLSYNTKMVSRKIRSGYYFNHVLDEVLFSLDK